MFLANNTQKLAVRILEAHIREGRVASSYIFSGRQEAGEMAEMASETGSSDIKEAFAVAFACALENGDKKLFTSGDSAISQRILKHAYPDVRWAGEDATERSIKIEAIRDVIQWAYLKPYEGAWKVCIVRKAERLTEEAANAFLKTLEEPPKQTVFCLLVENKGHLLETIQSRSFEIRLMPMAGQTVPAGVSSMKEPPIREIFENCGTLPRNEFKQKLDYLMLVSREKVYQLVKEEGSSAEESRRWLEAIDLFYDTKAALDMNTNQKLTATRLAMRLLRLFPSSKAVLG